MSGIKALERLRKFGSDVCWRIGGWTKHPEDMANEIADEIEAEVGCNYMPLPVDADGVPIRVGDDMANEEIGPLRVLGVFSTGFIWVDDAGECFEASLLGHSKYHHVKPDSIKELLEELIERAYTIEKVDSAPHPVVDERDIDEIAARIQEAVKR